MGDVLQLFNWAALGNSLIRRTPFFPFLATHFLLFYTLPGCHRQHFFRPSHLRFPLFLLGILKRAGQREKRNAYFLRFSMNEARPPSRSWMFLLSSRTVPNSSVVTT